MRTFQRSEKPRLLVISNVVPGQHFAGELRLIRLCQLLVRRFEVHVVATMALGVEESNARVKHLEGIGVVALPGSRTAVREALSRHPYDGVFVEFWHVGRETLPTIRRWQPWAKVIIDTVDLEFVRDERGIGFSHGRTRDVVATRKQLELATYGAVDALMFVSAAEQQTYRSLRELPAPSWVVPILVTLGTRTRRSRAPTVVFVGNFGHVPNVDAIVWFAREVWPQIRAAVPAATLRVVGPNGTAEISQLGDLDGVEVSGFVEDLAAAYDDAAVAVAPLRWGAGMKGKVCEALAQGVPVVTTTIGAEGLHVELGVDLVVADEAPEMARAVIALLDNATTAETIGARGQTAIAAQCLPDAAAPVVDELVDFLTDHGTRRAPRSWWVRVVAGRSLSRSRRVVARGHVRTRPVPMP